MNILFVGTNVSNEIEAKEKYISSAGNRFQNNLIKNFKNNGYNVTNLSYVAVPLEEPEKLSEDNSIVIKNKSLFASLFEFRKKIKREMKNADAVICYNIIYSWLFLPRMCKKYKKKSIAIVADFSDEDSFRSMPRKLYAKLQKKCIRRFDRVVGLSTNIAQYVNRNQEFVLVEGGIDKDYYSKFDTPYKKNEQDTIVLMYSGLLEPVTGIDVLLGDFRRISNEKLRLIITGKGSLEEDIVNISKEDSRIIFKGNLPYETYIATLGMADILVNPRNMSLPENRNNFPSKVLDYLATGNTIISTKFAGWQKFEQYILFTDDLENTITEVTKDLESKKFDSSNIRKFALQFIWDNQIRKIVE